MLIALYKMTLDVLKYLKKKSQEAWLNKDTKRLIFEFDNYQLIFTYKNFSKQIIENDDFFQVDDELLDRLVNFEVIATSIVSTENLGNREDIGQYNEAISQTRLLFHYLENLKLNIDLISDYRIVHDYEYNHDYLFCPSESNFGFIINIKKEAWAKKGTYEKILDSIDSSINYIPPLFYWQSYERYKNTIIQESLPINTTNTKTRRLGYYKLLSKLLNEKGSIPISILPKKFENYCIIYKEQLDKYKNNKGLISVTKSGISALPYLEFAKNIKLIVDFNRVTTPSKNFKLFSILKDLIDNKLESNIFELTQFEKFYFLELLLQKDFLYFSIILEYLFRNQNTNYKDIEINFYNFLKERISELSESFYLVLTPKEKKLQKGLNDVKKRIFNWDKPEKYLEHVLMPRLNWYQDLGLLEISQSLKEKSNFITLSDIGIKLFENICFWVDINCNRIIDPKIFINAFGIHLFDNIYFNGSVNEEIEKENVDYLINEYIQNSFNYFKTLAPNRVTSSQAITYCKYLLYFKNNIKVEQTYIENLLKNNKLNKFIYKYQKQFGDGYIQLKS